MNVVIDIESLSLQPDACILSIGAVAESGETLYLELDWEEQLPYRHVDAKTALWWGKQTEDPPLLGTWKLRTALRELSDWLSSYSREDLMVWARGPQFDIVVLEDAFKYHALPIPWSYRNVRDVRTAVAISHPSIALREPDRKHHALSDAIADMKNLAMRGITYYSLAAVKEADDDIPF